MTISKDGADFPHTVFLINLNAFEGKVRVLRLPEVCVLSNVGENKVILKECFQKSGEAAAAKAISQYFNLNVSRYISFTNQTFISFIDLFEPTAFDVSENMSEVDRESDVYIKIDKGRRLLGGSLMLDVFAYTKWEDGRTQGFFESARALCAFLSQNGADLLKAQQYLLENTKTNLSALDFENRRELISYALSLPDAAQSVKIYGQYAVENTQFTLTTASKTKIAALF